MPECNGRQNINTWPVSSINFFKFNWQAWLTEKDGGKQEGDEAMAFSHSAPFKVRSVMARAQTLPDEQGDSSHTPSFYMCCRTQQRMKADILMLSKKCDYRLFVKTSKKFKRMHYRSRNLNHKVVTIIEHILFNISYEKISRQIKQAPHFSHRSGTMTFIRSTI